VGCELDVETAAAAAHEDRVEQFGGFVEHRRVWVLLADRADATHDVPGFALSNRVSCVDHGHHS
jgi:hypothetical protein